MMTTPSNVLLSPESATGSLRVDGGRLWRSLMDLAQIGATPKGGVRRLALTDLDGQGRDLVVGWLKETGSRIEIDGAGNIFATRPGRDPAAPVVLTGSHIDTQPSGGKFDGNYGVLAGLEVLRTLNDAGIVTEHPVGVAIWTNEEGSRFVPVMGGSGAFAGVHTLEHVLQQRDLDGISFGDALKDIGYAGDAPVGGRTLDAYFEAHIEQGPILEREDKIVGVVTGALGLRWYDCIWTGQDAHAGPTPMEARRDALRGASQMVEAIHALAVRHAPDGRATVGFMQVSPNSRNVVPGLVKMTVDMRHPGDEHLAKMDRELRDAAAAIARDLRLECDLQQVDHVPASRFDSNCVEAVRAATRALGLPHREMVSGAGHDAIYIARVAPTSMIFVPCKDGISHNEIEDARPEHLGAGANVLLHAILTRALGSRVTSDSSGIEGG
jgi:beta-ureidopropionase / N-carbamoyl-L-amino-acid hydrolase